MPRQARLDAPVILHYVVEGGIEQTKIFGKNADQEDFLNRLPERRKEGALMVYAKDSYLTIFTNHLTSVRNEAKGQGCSLIKNKKSKLQEILLARRSVFIFCKRHIPWLLQAWPLDSPPFLHQPLLPAL